MLVVEDDDVIRGGIARQLKWADFEVDEADGGTEVATRRADSYDCVVLDLGLPGADGLDWLRRWRTEGSRVPVLVLTLRSHLHEVRAGLETGADDYLTKPYEASELQARVRALVRRSRPRPVRERMGDLELDRAERTLRHRGIRRSLTRKEFALLEVLFEARGAVVVHEELFERCWGERTDATSEPVKQHIARLRRKLGKDVIRSVRGEGYALSVAHSG